jgi:hypothetical protein
VPGNIVAASLVLSMEKAERGPGDQASPFVGRQMFGAWNITCIHTNYL